MPCRCRLRWRLVPQKSGFETTLLHFLIRICIMFSYLVSKIARPLPAVNGDDKKKFNSGVRALNRSLTASNPSAKKRLQNEKKSRKKSSSSPVPAPSSSAAPTPAVITRKRSIEDTELTPKPEPKRNRLFVTPATADEEEEDYDDDEGNNTNVYHYQTTEFVGWRKLNLVEKVTTKVGAVYMMVIPLYKPEEGTSLPRIRENISRHIKASEPEIFRGVNPSDMQGTFDSLLRNNNNIIQRNGVECWEFAVEVSNYPKRFDISNPNFPTLVSHITNCSKSSLNGLLVGDDDDWDEEANDGNHEETAEVVRLDTLAEQMRVLKKLNRMKKEELNSKLCKKDLFVAGKEKLKNIKIERDQIRMKQKRKLDLIDLAVDFFQLNLNNQEEELHRVMAEEQHSIRTADSWEESIAQECAAFNEIEYLNSGHS